MSWLALPFLLAATPIAPKTPGYESASVAVQIIAAEEIRFSKMKADTNPSKGMARQTRSRGDMPMVEFY